MIEYPHVVNCTVWFRMFIVVVLPVILVLQEFNPVAPNMVQLLQENNLAATSDQDCEYLETAVKSWLTGIAVAQSDSRTENQDTYILWAQLLPVRCEFQKTSLGNEPGVITDCGLLENYDTPSVCEVWNITESNPSPDYFAEELNIRQGGIFDYFLNDTVGGDNYFSVRVMINHNNIISVT